MSNKKNIVGRFRSVSLSGSVQGVLGLLGLLVPKRRAPPNFWSTPKSRACGVKRDLANSTVSCVYSSITCDAFFSDPVPYRNRLSDCQTWQRGQLLSKACPVFHHVATGSGGEGPEDVLRSGARCSRRPPWDWTCFTGLAFTPCHRSILKLFMGLAY